jgi:hypothetical protein
MRAQRTLASRPISGLDGLIFLIILFSIAAAHFVASHALLQSNVLKSYNWAFDFDSARFGQIWCTRDYNPADYSMSWAFRHPLIMALRPICFGIQAVGLSVNQAVLLLAGLSAGLGAGLAYLYCRTIALQRIDALLMTLWFALSAQPLMLGALPEAYGLALCGIGLSFIVTAKQALGLPTSYSLRHCALVINAGVTITNVLLPVFSEAMHFFRSKAKRSRLKSMTLFFFAGFGLFVLFALGLNLLFRPSASDTAIDAAKQVWWSVHINNEQPASLFQIARTLMVYNLVAPDFTTVLIEPAAPKPMLDFRLWLYDSSGLIAIILSLALVLVGTFRAFTEPALRPIALTALFWIAFNVLLYRYWQYRGSIYIYGAHVSFALLALAALTLKCGLPKMAHIALRFLALCALILVGHNNLHRYHDMIHHLETAHVYAASTWHNPATVGAQEVRASHD